MAGAGYKLFNTGDVLTAAQVNTYLMEQTVMRFATTAARDTALSGVLAEGMLCYIDADNNIYKYTGSAWVNIDSTGGGSPLTTKGDLYTYSTTDARLAVGNNGETLVADSSASTGLRWQGNFAAGKNKIINGDFAINQRNFSSITATGYGFDRWYFVCTDGTVTHSTQAFTPGTAPVAGYEGTNFARVVTTGQTLTTAQATLRQRIEDVRTFANQTATVSFWAKAASGTPKIAIEIDNNYGSGGSTADYTYAGQVTLSTSWTRYSVTVNIATVSGKTLGSSSYRGLTFWLSGGSSFDARTGTLGIQSNTFDIWGVQLEAGSVATAFQTATGTLAGELAACQRYYYRTVATGSYGTVVPISMLYDSTQAVGILTLPVTMRVAPTSVDFSSIKFFRYDDASYNISAVSLSTPTTSPQFVQMIGTISGGTAGWVGRWVSQGSTSSYLGVSAEL